MFTDARNCLIMNKLQNGSMEAIEIVLEGFVKNGLLYPKKPELTRFVA